MLSDLHVIGLFYDASCLQCIYEEEKRLINRISLSSSTHSLFWSIWWFWLSEGAIEKKNRCLFLLLQIIEENLYDGSKLNIVIDHGLQSTKNKIWMNMSVGWLNWTYSPLYERMMMNKSFVVSSRCACVFVCVDLFWRTREKREERRRERKSFIHSFSRSMSLPYSHEEKEVEREEKRRNIMFFSQFCQKIDQSIDSSLSHPNSSFFLFFSSTSI